MITLHLLPLPAAGEPSAACAGLEKGLNRPGAVPSLVHAFHRVGDGAEAHLVGVLRSGVEAVGLVLSLVRSDGWAVVVGHARESAAGEPVDPRAAERARRSPGRCAVRRGPAATAPWIEPSLQLLGALERRRSEPQQDAGRRIESGASQREVAAQLEVTQQAVHARLRSGLWNETRVLAGAVADELEAGPSDV